MNGRILYSHRFLSRYQIRYSRESATIWPTRWICLWKTGSEVCVFYYLNENGILVKIHPKYLQLKLILRWCFGFSFFIRIFYMKNLNVQFFLNLPQIEFIFISLFIFRYQTRSPRTSATIWPKWICLWKTSSKVWSHFLIS